MFIVLSASKTSHSVGVLCGDLSTVYSGSHMPFQTIVTHGTPPECDVGATQCYKHAAPPERRMIFASGSKAYRTYHPRSALSFRTAATNNSSRHPSSETLTSPVQLSDNPSLGVSHQIRRDRQPLKPNH